MTGSDRYVVRWEGKRDPHRLIFSGPDARERAIRYARERGSNAEVIGPDGRRVWWITDNDRSLT